MEIGKLFNGKLDLDNSIEAVKEGDYTALFNGIIGRSPDGQRSTLENMLGTENVYYYGNNAGLKCIGGCKDPKSETQFLFLKPMVGEPAVGDKIVKVTNNVMTDVMQWDGLLFTEDYPISHAAFINGYLYFADGINGLRGFKVSKYEYGQPVPTSEEDIALMKRGPIFAPTFVKDTNALINVNLVENKDFQFAFLYVYEDNQVSVTSPYSKLCRRNLETETGNRIRVTIPDDETVPPNVKEIRLAVRVGNGASLQYIGTLKRSEGGFVTNRYIDFYNTVYGGAVPTDYLGLYHDIPLKAECLEFIKNRLWLANTTEGYDVPMAPNMTINTSVINNPIAGEPILTGNVTSYVITKYNYLATASPSSITDIYPQYPQSLAYNNPESVSVKLMDAVDDGYGTVTGKLLFDEGDGSWKVIDPAYVLAGTIPPNAPNTHLGHEYVGGIPPVVSGNIYPYGSLILAASVVGLDVNGTTYYAYRITSTETFTLKTFVPEGEETAYAGSKTFPNGSQYKVGLVYKDHYGRSSSVLLGNNDGLVSSSGSQYSNIVTATWSLPSSQAFNANLQIPEWAESYHIVRTRNLTKSIFFEWKSSQVRYYKLNTVDGTLTYFTTFSPNNTGLAIDILPMDNVGLGYSWQDGDRIVMYSTVSADTYNAPIKSYSGGTVYLDNINFFTANAGVIPDQTVVFEIYRPAVISETLLFYEVGEGYKIGEAGTQSRHFTVASGSIGGDSYNVSLKTYSWSGAAYVEDGANGLFKEMSVDVTSSDWNSDIGKAHIISDIGQKVRPYTFKHSSPVINDSQVNGLSEFYASDQKDVPYENGEIFKLKAANRTASDGTVLLAISRNRVTSIYVDESRLNINSDVNYIVTGSQVIGDVNTLAGWYGTVHPESVFDDGEFVYWYCMPRRCFVRYGNNGIFPISEYNAIDYFETVSDTHTEDDMVVGGYFPYYDLAVIHFPNADVNKKVFTYENAMDAWRGWFNIEADYYFTLDNTFYSFTRSPVSEGASELWKHTDNTQFGYGRFHGTRYYTQIEIPLNNNSDLPKIWQTIELFVSPNFITWSNGNQIIKTTEDSDLYVEVFNEEGQYTSVLRSEFEIGEYLIYAALGKDVNSTGGIVNGSDMSSRVATLRINFIGQDYRYVPMVKIGFIPSLGHTL